MAINGSATPALRVKSFVEAFPNHLAASICADDYADVMRAIGLRIRMTLGR